MRISGSAGSDNASGPCSAYFLSVWKREKKHASKFYSVPDHAMTTQCDFDKSKFIL